MLVRAKSTLLSRLKSLTSLQRFNHTLTEEGLQAQVYPEMGSDFLAQQNYVLDMSKWRRINARRFGVTRSMIPDAPYTVLKLLRVGGFQAYLVGGCVRDLLLNKVPKDFDVITTAELNQIKETFYRAEIIGHRFPICKVNVKGSVIEVSSFETLALHSEEKEKVLSSQMPSGCNEKDFLRWRNSMHRDFTINSLFFDPFANQIYDYANGLADLRSLKLRTLIPAELSFQEDCARILRGIRIAGRLGLSISKDTDTAIRKLSSSIMSLSKSRISMELNYMLSYGAAASTIHLLQKFNLLEIFFPFHAAYLRHQASEISTQSSMMLMGPLLAWYPKNMPCWERKRQKLFFNLDKMVSSDRPCDCNLWVGLLAFHQALVLCPQDASVIWVLASMLYRGTWEEGVKFARENAKLQDRFVPEISGFSEIASDNELAKQVSHLEALVQDAVVAFTEESSLCRSMSRYPDSTFYDLVFVPKKIGGHVIHLFDVSFYENRRESSKIDYDLLRKGNLHESRFVLGKVILETLSGGFVEGGMEIIKEKPRVVEIIKEKPRVVKKNNEPKRSDLVKDGLVVKEEIEHALLSVDLEPKQKRSKKQEKEKMECFLEKEINSIKEEVVDLKDASEEMAKKYQKIVDTSQLCEEKPSPPQQESGKKRVADGNDKYQHRDKRDKKMLQKVKHWELDDKGTIQLFNVVKNSNFTNNCVNKEEEEDDPPPELQEVVKQKTKKLKKVLVKENSGRPLLSSLFKQ